MSMEKIRLEILNNPGLEAEARKLAKQILQENKQELINEFNAHPVTMEIEAGPSASNRSGTLGSKGNLFSFIGFSEGDSPLEPVRALLDKIQLASTRAIKSGAVVEFKVNLPSKSEFESASKMPWESGRSWLYDIERAISGLGNYLYGRFQNSRSGTGVQLEKSVTSQTFTPVKYFGTMLDKFVNKLKGI